MKAITFSSLRHPVGRRRARSTGRAVPLLLLGALLIIGCEDSESLTTPPPPPASVASVTVSAGSSEVAVDDEVQLVATALDADGNVLVDRQIQWESSDPTVAAVSTDGLVSGLGLGSATITATVEGVRGTLALDVSGFLIGPSGGEAGSADGSASIDIPPGALDGSIVITVEAAGTTGLPEDDGDVLIPGTAYRFGPEGQQFTAPVTLTIRYDQARIPTGIDESALMLGRAEGSTWAEVANTTVDMSADAVHGSVQGFSVYGAIGEPVNRPPTATIEAPAHGSSFVWGTSVAFSGAGWDSDDGTLPGGSLVWTSDLDGQFGTGGSVTTSGLSVGTHTITLTVTDSHGGTDTDTITVTITNNPPTATITGPADGSSYASGTSVTFTGTGTDPEDGSLSGGSLVWTSDLDGQFGTGGSVTTSGLSVGTHTITLTVTDSHGGTDTDTITVTIV